MSSTNQIPLATFEELVAQYHHRLLSLEADLKDRARSGKMTPRVFAKRVQRLEEVHQVLAGLKELCTAETQRKSQPVDLGLPDLDECTPAEQQICIGFLRIRARESRELAQQTARVFRWLQDSVEGRVTFLRTTLRLSKLRRYIQTFDKRAASLQSDSNALARHVDKLIKSLPPARAKHAGVEFTAGRQTLEALMQLFQQLDTTISRVAKLRASVKKEEIDVKHMQSWLAAQTTQLRATTTTQPPPSPLQAARAAASVDRTKPRDRTFAKSRRRRALVERYWQDVIQQK